MIADDQSHIFSLIFHKTIHQQNLYLLHTNAIFGISGHLF